MAARRYAAERHADSNWYVYDRQEDEIVAGPISSQHAARAAARERNADDNADAS